MGRCARKAVAGKDAETQRGGERCKYHGSIEPTVRTHCGPSEKIFLEAKKKLEL